jgi:hypothetical protein
MTKERNKMISRLKSYHIIILGCILGCLLTFNSNYINEQKATMKLNKEKSELFDRIISKRRLQEIEEGDEDVIYLTSEVCSHSSDDLKEYYQSGDLTKIDLEPGLIECKDKDNKYVKALIGVLEGFIKDEDSSENPNTIPNNNDNNSGNDDNGGNDDGNPEDRERLRLLSLDEEGKENIKIYVDRILPMAVFLGIGILCIIGWLVCCFASCCDCCCCCCFKKEGCKIPCFIFTYIFYALVITVCIYGLTQTNKIFTGIANTECSFMKFFDDILDGEEKEETPKWIGINGVSNMLNSLYDTVEDMENSDLNANLESKIRDIDEERSNFMPELKSTYKNYYTDRNDGIDGVDPNVGYYVEYNNDAYIKESDSTTINYNGKYMLDIFNLLGRYDNDKQNYTGYLYLWDREISEIDNQASGTLNSAAGSFRNMLNENIGEIKRGLHSGITSLGELRKPFDDVYDVIADAIYDSSVYIDKYGKLSVQLVFGILAAMNLALGILVLLICLFSGQSCADCCCCRCICKCATHIIWNLLAFLMIIAFIIGSLLSLLGAIGSDMMSVFSYIVSEENFNKGDSAVIINKLEEGKDILKECFIGNGRLTELFNLSDVTDDFDIIQEKKNEIQGYMDEFRERMNYPSYTYLKSLLENRLQFTEDTNLILLDPQSNTPEAQKIINLDEIIKKLNDSPGADEKWNLLEGDKDKICIKDQNDGFAKNSQNVLHPWTCEPYHRDWIEGSGNTDITNYAKIATDIIDLLKYAKGEIEPADNPNYKSYYDILDELKGKYEVYLNKYMDVLEFFDDVIDEITSALEEAIGSNGQHDTFSFLDGKFIRNDLKILLKYLQYSLGEDIYTVGLCLVIVGFSLILSVSSTILLLVIINISLESNKKFSQQTEVPEFPVNNDGRIMQFKNAL